MGEASEGTCMYRTGQQEGPDMRVYLGGYGDGFVVATNNGDRWNGTGGKSIPTQALRQNIPS